MSAPSPLRKIWAVPALLAALTLAGLLSALLGGAWPWKALAWLLLAVPLAAGLWFARPRRPRA